MTREWEAGAHYNVGERICFNGTDYNVIQAHTSQGDWLPPNVPAIYGAAGPAHSHGSHEQHGGGYDQQHGSGYGQPPPPQYNQPQQGQPQHGYGGQPPQQHQQQPFGGQTGQQNVAGGHGQGAPAPPPPTKYSEGHGFDDGGSDKSDASDDEFDKKKLAMGIGGGLGLAALVGGGIYAYTRHKSKTAEEAKKEAWSENATQQTWQSGAEKRTRELASTSKKPPVYWVLADRPGDIPHDAIPIGREANGETLYAARAFYQGGLHVGKAGKHFNPPGAIISWGGGSMTVEKYEVLVGDPRAITWKRFDERPHVRGWQPVDAGREADGTFLFLAKTDDYHGGVQVGKVREDEDAVCFGYGDGEVKSKPYYIAAYA